MVKTLETLFRLSSFMKHLVAEGISEEHLECPTYALNSLYDLSATTTSWIEKLKREPKIERSHSVGQLTELNSSRNYDKNEDLKVSENDNIVGNQVHTALKTSDVKDYQSGSVPNSQLEQDLTSPSSLPVNVEEKDCLNKIEKEHPQVLTSNFLKLCDEMHNGKQFGNYCGPCDVVISSELWEKHLNEVHRVNINNDENEASCTHCNLIAFGSNTDLDQLFIHHLKKHFVSGNVIQCTNIKNTDGVDLVDSDQHIRNVVEAKEEDLISFECETQNDSVPDLDVRLLKEITSVFIELDRKVHIRNEKGYFCYPCDMAFGSLPEWISHFEKMESIHDLINDCFGKCANCDLVIFAKSTILAVYKRYHMHGHNKEHQPDNDI